MSRRLKVLALECLTGEEADESGSRKYRAGGQLGSARPRALSVGSYADTQECRGSTAFDTLRQERGARFLGRAAAGTSRMPRPPREGSIRTQDPTEIATAVFRTDWDVGHQTGPGENASCPLGAAAEGAVGWRGQVKVNGHVCRAGGAPFPELPDSGREFGNKRCARDSARQPPRGRPPRAPGTLRFSDKAARCSLPPSALSRSVHAVPSAEQQLTPKRGTPSFAQGHDGEEVRRQFDPPPGRGS